MLALRLFGQNHGKRLAVKDGSVATSSKHYVQNKCTHLALSHRSKPPRMKVDLRKTCKSVYLSFLPALRSYHLRNSVKDVTDEETGLT